MKIIKKIFFSIIFLNSFALVCQTSRPNIVIIYADDMGFSDVGVYGDLYNIQSPSSTPKMDNLASEGMIFTQAHSSSTVCTPSRYSLLTGIYNFRTMHSISQRYGQPEIPEEEITIAEYLKTQGYQTAAFGKWHLGGQFYNRQGQAYVGRNHDITNPENVDWEHTIDGHAVDHGFDVFKGLAASINFPPYVYLEGKRAQYFNTNTYRNALNTDTYHYFSTAELRDGLAIGQDGRAGLGDPTYKQIDAGPKAINDIEQYIEDRVGEEQPFFIYASLYSPHKPWHITDEFKDIEGFSYGDFMHEVDNRIGRIIEAIDDNGFFENTLIILTSDNGPETTAFTNSRSNGKDPNGPFRGVKRDSWEGGTRVPFIVRWPDLVEAGSISNQLIWQGDIFSTVADYLGECLPEGIAPDAVSILPILEGDIVSINRNPVVNSTIRSQVSLKTNDGWKLIDGTGGGGNATSYDAENQNISNAIGDVGGSPKQLFYLNNDIGETNNLVTTNSNKANEMFTLLNSIIQTPVTTPNNLLSLNPTDAVTVSAALPADPGLQGNFTLRERKTGDDDPNRHISGFVKFDFSLISSFDPLAGDRAFFEVKLQDRLNTNVAINLNLARITGGNWDSTNLPQYNWATASNILAEAPSQTDEIVLIKNINEAYLHGSYSADVSSILDKWINNNIPNYGFGLYLTDSWNGVNLEDIKLIVYKATDQVCKSQMAMIYKDCDYEGDGISIGIGEYPNIDDLGIISDMNDELSSLRVEDGYQVTLYEGLNFTGSSVTITADDNCLIDNNFNEITSSIIVQEFTDTLSSDSLNYNYSIKIHPNPTDGRLIVTSKNFVTDRLFYKINGMDGRSYIKGSKTIDHGNKSITLDIESLHSGIYIIEIMNANGINYIQKIVKQ